MPKSIYIAGKMSGLPAHGYPAFYKAEKVWKEKGWKVYNPAHHSDEVGPNLPYEYYIRESIKDLLLVDAIALLTGWETSRGAKLELHIAKMLNLDVYDEQGNLDPDIDLIVEPPEKLLGKFFA